MDGRPVMRVVNRLLVFVVGAALLAGGVLVIIEGIWTWTNSGFVWIPGDQIRASKRKRAARGMSCGPSQGRKRPGGR